jgi:hypothetical protein
MRRLLSLLCTITFLSMGAPAWATDPVAVLTEFRQDAGEVAVRRAGEADWSRPQALLALRPGDQVRVSGKSRAVLVFTGGRGTMTVTQANSPLTVEAPTGKTATERVRDLLGSVTQFLLAQPKAVSYQSLSVRSVAAVPPLIVSPRETRLLGGPVTFEWSGAERLRYRLRVLGPDGLQWEQANLRRQPVEYPASAPPLRPGVRYRWEVVAEGHPGQSAQFELLAGPEAGRVRAALGDLQPAALPGFPQNTVVLMRAGLLLQERLYYDARRELLAGIAADPDEPALHVLLARVYEGTGLPELAAQAHDEAQFLSTLRP